MNQAMNNTDYQYDRTCRLSAQDKEMMSRVTSINRFGSTVRNTTIDVRDTNCEDRKICPMHLVLIIETNSNSCFLLHSFVPIPTIYRKLPWKAPAPAPRKQISRQHPKIPRSWRKRNWRRFTCPRRSSFKLLLFDESNSNFVIPFFGLFLGSKSRILFGVEEWSYSLCFTVFWGGAN